MPKQLLPSERLMLPPLHRHWILLVRGVTPSAAVTALLLFAVDVLLRQLLPGDVRLLLSAAAAAFVGLVLLVVWMRWEGDSLTVTDQRVILEEGVFQRTSRAIPLNRLQDVFTTQTLPGRLLDYGTIEIAAAGTGGVERFAYIRCPERVRDQVFLVVGGGLARSA